MAHLTSIIFLGDAGEVGHDMPTCFKIASLPRMGFGCVIKTHRNRKFFYCCTCLQSALIKGLVRGHVRAQVVTGTKPVGAETGTGADVKFTHLIKVSEADRQTHKRQQDVSLQTQAPEHTHKARNWEIQTRIRPQTPIIGD